MHFNFACIFLKMYPNKTEFYRNFHGKALEIKNISRIIADYVVDELSASTDNSKSKTLYYSGDIVQQSIIISEEIIKAEKSIFSEKKYFHACTIEWLISRLLITCKRIESSCSKSKDFIKILKKEVKKFKLLQNYWMLTL